MPGKVSELINSDDLVFVSIASLWELTIKGALGKIRFSKGVFDKFESRGYKLLLINTDHLKQLAALPQIHRDPLDRIIISQARQVKLLLVTADQEIIKYAVKCHEVKT